MKNLNHNVWISMKASCNTKSQNEQRNSKTLTFAWSIWKSKRPNQTSPNPTMEISLHYPRPSGPNEKPRFDDADVAWNLFQSVACNFQEGYSKTCDRREFRLGQLGRYALPSLIYSQALVKTFITLMSEFVGGAALGDKSEKSGISKVRGCIIIPHSVWVHAVSLKTQNRWANLSVKAHLCESFAGIGAASWCSQTRYRDNASRR